MLMALAVLHGSGKEINLRAGGGVDSRAGGVGLDDSQAIVARADSLRVGFK